MTRLSLLLLYILAANNALIEAGVTSNHIVGGIQADIAEFPYQVSIRLESNVLIHICGGTIYAPKVIVTAAHCIKGRFASYIRIVAGKSSIVDQTEQGVRAYKLIYHSGYNKKTHENDIGLIILREALVFNNVIQPIALAVDFPVAGSHAIVSGWGKHEENSENLPAVLHSVSVHIVDHVACDLQYATKEYSITEQMICAGVDEGGKDACKGDSGGPLVVDGVLAGVVSWGLGCARPDFPGVYASVAYHGSWVEHQAELYLN